jgi:hypothetical protein
MSHVVANRVGCDSGCRAAGRGAAARVGSTRNSKSMYSVMGMTVTVPGFTLAQKRNQMGVLCAAAPAAPALHPLYFSPSTSAPVLQARSPADLDAITVRQSSAVILKTAPDQALWFC